jgi:hypothetical protein
MLDVYGEIFRTRAGGKLEKTVAIEAQVCHRDKRRNNQKLFQFSCTNENLRLERERKKKEARVLLTRYLCTLVRH